MITRDSIRQALRGGITAAQIVRFLRMHAHPQQQKAHAAKVEEGEVPGSAGGSSRHQHLIPPTVVDQIHLWEKERNRY